MLLSIKLVFHYVVNVKRCRKMYAKKYLLEEVCQKYLLEKGMAKTLYGLPYCPMKFVARPCS